MNESSKTNDKNVISNKFNDFFINIGPGLANKIALQTLSPIHFMNNNITNTIFLEPVSRIEIDKIIMSLKNCATGYDDISAQIFKLCVEHIGDPLTYLCNRFLLQGVFPHEMKTANVIPLYKSGDPMLFTNYRPISLLCIISKIFERVMYTRLISFLERFKILIKNQFGFRKNHSSYMALKLC